MIAIIINDPIVTMSHYITSKIYLQRKKGDILQFRYLTCFWYIYDTLKYGQELHQPRKEYIQEN